jgi:hypothetical protein
MDEAGYELVYLRAEVLNPATMALLGIQDLADLRDESAGTEPTNKTRFQIVGEGFDLGTSLADLATLWFQHYDQGGRIVLTWGEKHPSVSDIRLRKDGREYVADVEWIDYDSDA